MPAWRRISAIFQRLAAPSSNGWKARNCPAWPFWHRPEFAQHIAVANGSSYTSNHIRMQGQGTAMNTADMTAKIAAGNGFIAALDQSGGSTPKALKGYGIEEGAWSSEEEMFGLIHQMRSRIITSPVFTGDKVLGAILFERTMDGMAGGKPVPQALIERGIIPFIKVDKGLEDEVNGCQLMKPMPTLDALLERSKALGVYGTKERSVVNSANREGIAAVVDQQFEVGKQVLSHGMMPIIEP